MTGSILASSWYRVASLRPQLRSHARLHRHRYRDEVWYLLQDPISNRVHRFTPAARVFLAAMDGQRSVQALWELAQRQLGDDAPTQDDVINLLGQLHAADLLRSDVSPDAAELFERGKAAVKSQRQRSYMNPMAIRIHLLDPDRMLNRLSGLIRLLWSRWGFLLWLAVVLPALMLLPPHWSELSGGFTDRVLAVDNLLLLWLVFPLIKAAHEFGHAIAVKRGGGEVHDVGLVMLVLLPVPYVEASASTVFRSKYERAMVGAAGMVVELFIAAIAFYFWMIAEPGPVRAVLFNVMVVAGVSTLLFNGNPLLRYDAYYILADLIEMPNLATRSIKYWGYLIERYAFGADVETPPGTRAEKTWLVFYGVGSILYRVFVTITIAWFIAGEFFFVGVVLALWAVFAMAVLPVAKSLIHVAESPRLHVQRKRVWAVVGSSVTALLLALFVMPFPSRTMAEGVVWLPDDALVRTHNDGFVERLLATPGAAVTPGQPLVAMREPVLEADLRMARAKLAEAQATYAARLADDRVQAGIAADHVEAARTLVDELERRARELTLVAAAAGTFVVPSSADVAGQHRRKGEPVAYVIDKPSPLVRVVVQQDSVDLVRRDTQAVQVRLAHRPDHVMPARIAREVPAGGEYLPSRALSAEGGGALVTDPRDQNGGGRTLERTFQFDLRLPDDMSGPAGFFGSRVHVRFQHAPLPLGVQWLRSLRRVFLSHFHV